MGQGADDQRRAARLSYTYSRRCPIPATNGKPSTADLRTGSAGGEPYAVRNQEPIVISRRLPLTAVCAVAIALLASVATAHARPQDDLISLADAAFAAQIPGRAAASRG